MQRRRAEPARHRGIGFVRRVGPLHDLLPTPCLSQSPNFIIAAQPEIDSRFPRDRPAALAAPRPKPPSDTLLPSLTDRGKLGRGGGSTTARAAPDSARGDAKAEVG